MGKLIVIDGLDGSGKSTQLARVGAYLTGRGVPCRQICFPDYDKPASTLVKMYLNGDFGQNAADVNAYAASSFYAVERYASYKQYWEPDYVSGSCILTARYTTSNAIHQMCKLPETEWDAYLSWLEDYEYGKLSLPKPDAVLFLDMPLAVSQKLLEKRYAGDAAKKDLHERDKAYLARCRETALYVAARQGWHVIACAETDVPLPVETITDRLTACLAPLSL